MPALLFVPSIDHIVATTTISGRVMNNRADVIISTPEGEFLATSNHGVVSQGSRRGALAINVEDKEGGQGSGPGTGDHSVNSAASAWRSRCLVPCMLSRVATVPLTPQKVLNRVLLYARPKEDLNRVSWRQTGRQVLLTQVRVR